MQKTDIKTNMFLDRLSVVYGDDASKQQERYLALAERFEKEFGEATDLRFFSAPGRTEVGGNHTDHQHGQVLAAAVNLEMLAWVKPNDSTIIRVMSEGYTMSVIDVSDLEIKQ